MNNCKHKVELKVENGVAITYCVKCGAILSARPCGGETRTKDRWQEGLLKDNGGSILHDTPEYDLNGNILHD